jgi:nucleoside-diphosphate-sugar epimerase
MHASKEEKVALVTGATGYVGSQLVKRLVSEGWNVHIIVRPQSDLRILSSITENVTIHVHDGTTEGMCGILFNSKPLVVFHLASLFLVQHKTSDIETLVASNILFGTQLVEAMVRHGAHSLINTGTSWQHHNNEDYCPVNLYAATKQAFEHILQFYVESTPLKATTLKLFDTYGPCDTRPKLFSALRKAAEEHLPLAMSPGEQLLDIVYIDDVVEAFIVASHRLLKEQGAKYEEYAVSSGKHIKLRELVDVYQHLIGRELPIEWGGRSYREREVMVPWSKGKKLPRWEPRVELREGITAVLGRPQCEAKPLEGRVVYDNLYPARMVSVKQPPPCVAAKQGLGVRD